MESTTGYTSISPCVGDLLLRLAQAMALVSLRNDTSWQSRVNEIGKVSKSGTRDHLMVIYY